MPNPFASSPSKPAKLNTWRGLLLAGLVGLALVPIGIWALNYLVPFSVVVSDMMRGRPNYCDSASKWSFAHSRKLMDKEFAESHAEVQQIASDPAFDIVKIKTSVRDFWVPRQGAEMDGKFLIAYLLAEHRWMEKVNPDRQVKPGDTVIDCGAHVGIFTDSALRRGAAKVIAFEIDPVNLECLRRNFAKEIAEQRLVVVAQGVWSSETTMNFTISNQNSGRGSLVIQGFGATTIPAPLTRIDVALEALGIQRVDFIKMDIEGAEREALAGAAKTLRRYKPILALDAYHLPDDPAVLPRIILAANPAYTATCGPSERFADTYKPHVLYYR